MLKNISIPLFVLSISVFSSCNDDSQKIYTKPYVESFVAKNDGRDFLILLAYGGSAFNSIGDPLISRDQGEVCIQFTNRKAHGADVNSIHTSFRSFSGADRQVSAIIEISQNVKNVSYLYDGECKQIWPTVE